MQAGIGCCEPGVVLDMFALQGFKRKILMILIPFKFAKLHESNSIGRFEMEETTKKLTFVVIFLSVVVATLFGLAPVI